MITNHFNYITRISYLTMEIKHWIPHFFEKINEVIWYNLGAHFNMRVTGIVNKIVLFSLSINYLVLFLTLNIHLLSVSIVIAASIIIHHLILVLLTKRLINLSKYLFLSQLILIPLFVVLFEPDFINSRSIFLTHLFYLMSIIFMFSYERGRIVYVLLLASSFCFILIHEFFIYKLSSVVYYERIFGFCSSIVMWLFILLTHLTYRSFVKRHLAIKKRLYSSLEKQKNQIESLNQTLSIVVQEKTRDFKSLEIQLNNYSMFSSHEVRGPLARILGLNYLLINNGFTSKQEIKNILHMLNSEAIDLDEKITNLIRMSESQ